jgi:osmotically-inducible protein OsmY
MNWFQGTTGKVCHRALWITAVFTILPGVVVGQTYVWNAPVDRSAQQSDNDLQLTLRIRKSLSQDDKLAQCAVGVTVHDRLAKLWGSVPSGEVSRRVEDHVREVLGVAAVHNDLHVMAPFDSAPIPGADLLARARSEWLEKDRSIPAKQSNGPDQSKQQVTLVWRPAATDSAQSPPATVKRPSGTVLREEVAGSSLPVHSSTTPPALAQSPRDTVRSTPALSLAPPEVPSGRATTVLSSSLRPLPPDNVTSSIETLRRDQPRYRAIGYRVLDGVVFVASGPADSSVTYEFAQVVSRLPGVTKVIIENALSQGR